MARRGLSASQSTGIDGWRVAVLRDAARHGLGYLWHVPHLGLFLDRYPSGDLTGLMVDGTAEADASLYEAS